MYVYAVYEHVCMYIYVYHMYVCIMYVSIYFCIHACIYLCGYVCIIFLYYYYLLLLYMCVSSTIGFEVVNFRWVYKYVFYIRIIRVSTFNTLNSSYNAHSVSSDCRRPRRYQIFLSLIPRPNRETSVFLFRFFFLQTYSR